MNETKREIIIIKKIMITRRINISLYDAIYLFSIDPEPSPSTVRVFFVTPCKFCDSYSSPGNGDPTTTRELLPQEKRSSNKVLEVSLNDWTRRYLSVCNKCV